MPSMALPRNSPRSSIRCAHAQLDFTRRQARGRQVFAIGSALMGAAVVLTGYAAAIPPAVLITLVLIFARMSGPAMQIQQSVQNFFFGLPAFEAIRKLEQDLDASAAPAPIPVAPPPGAIELQGVSFLHPGGGGLHPADLRIEHGSFVGITGPSGAGKTTLIELLTTLQEPQTGRMLVGGEPLDAARRAGWRESLAYVPQEGFLFNDMVRRNLVFATNTRYVRLNVTANSGWQAAQISELEIYGVAGSGSGNLAAGKTMTASAYSQTYTASNGNDGNQSTYWESANNAFPQWLQVDLGATVAINRVVLKLPTSWGNRNQTLAVQSSTNGSTFSDLVASASYTFNQSASNVVTINFNQATTRYVRVNITANTVWRSRSDLGVRGVRTHQCGLDTTECADEPRVHAAGFGADPAGLERVDRQRGCDRIRRLRQQQPAHERGRQRAHLHRQPCGDRDGDVLRAGQGRGR